MKDNVRIGKYIKTKRKQAKLTQLELAEIIGVTDSAISRWESGEIDNIGRSKIIAMAKALDVDEMSLLHGQDSEDENNKIKNINPVKIKKIPLLGEIAAGEPIYVSEDIAVYMDVTDDIKADYCLRVKGDSMIGARINDGDIVFIHTQPNVENGEIAAVLIDDEATLKRVYKTSHSITLVAANPNYEPIVVSEDDGKNVRILGKAIAFQSYI